MESESERHTMQLPPLNTLQAFEATARLCSLSRAGDELCLTHAAVSHQIKRLETWFGRKLFQRSGRGIELTPAGVEFHQAVDAALVTIAITGKKLQIRRDRKRVPVACLPSIATRWLVPALPDFTQKNPGVNVQISYARALESFDSELHDVLITHGADASAGVQCSKLFSRINQPVASAVHVERNPRLLKANGFDGAHLLHDETFEAWNDWFKKAGYTPNGVTHGPIYQDFNLLATGVIAGHGIALCPIEVFRREIGDGDLVVLSEIATLEDEGYYVVQSRQSNREVDAFTDWFKEVCKAELPNLKKLGIVKQTK